MDYNLLRKPFLELDKEERLELIMSVRNSRLALSDPTKKRKSKVATDNKQKKLLSLIQELSEDDRQQLVLELEGLDA